MEQYRKFVAEPLWVQQSIDSAKAQLDVLNAIDIDAEIKKLDDECEETIKNALDGSNNAAKAKAEKAIINAAYDERKKQLREFIKAQISGYSNELNRLIEEKKKYGYIDMSDEEKAARISEETAFHENRFQRQYEENKQLRQAHYKEIVDPLSAELARTDDAEKRAALQSQIDALVEKIRADFPYPEGYPKQ